MEEQTKLGIIIGCSLGGAAILVVGILTLVCCLCARRKRTAKKNAARGLERLEDVSYNKDSLSKSGMPPGFQPQFIGNAPQQWRNNYSMTAAAAGVIGSNQDDVRQTPTNPGAAGAANPIVSSDKPVIKPWYQKTLGRARQLFDNGTSVTETKRESSEILVGSSAGNLKSGPSSAYILSKRVEDKHLSNASSESSGDQTTYNHSSQSTLLANDFAALTPHGNPAAASNIAPHLAARLDNSPATTAVSEPALHASSTVDAAPSGVDIDHNPASAAISDPGPTSDSNLATPIPNDLIYNVTNLNGNSNLRSTVEAPGVTNLDNNSTSFDSSPVLRNSPGASSYSTPLSSTPLEDTPAPYSNLDIYRPVLPTQPAIYSPVLHQDQPEAVQSDPGAAGSDPTLQQLALPRPMLINEGGLRQRVHSFLPPAVPRKPVRIVKRDEVDAGNERARENGSGMSAEPVVSIDPSSSSVIEQSSGAQRLNVQAVIEPIPRSQHDSQLSDEKSVIGEAFKFLDDVE